ncbi:MAG: hypothetical protein ACJAU6_002255 [Alphaproteobacteria bacterium]|jgi:hypothetical protein
MIEVLEAVDAIGPVGAWVGAGFVRNKVWDALHGYLRPSLLNDVDVIYFDPKNQSVASEKAVESALLTAMPLVPWSVRNQARMHHKSSAQPAVGTLDAMRYWPETATALAVCKRRNKAMQFVSCYGLDDLLGLAVKPSPNFPVGAYRRRILAKDWLSIWPMLKIYGLSD